MQETPFQYPSRIEKSNKKIIYIIIGVIILASLFIGWLVTRPSVKPEEKKDVVIEQKEPSPTEKPKIEKTSVKIQVVNGTGTPGQAGVVVKALEAAGYSADNIKSTNADTYDNLVTSISARANFEEIVSDIKTVLKPTFAEITDSSPNLSEDSAFDIVVLTGGKTFETVTPTTAATDSGSLSPSPTTSPTPTP